MPRFPGTAAANEQSRAAAEAERATIIPAAVFLVASSLSAAAAVGISRVREQRAESSRAEREKSGLFY